MADAGDPYDLNRFVEAQECRYKECQKRCYEQALSEVETGLKVHHWIWYIFPQFEGLGHSWNSEHYSIKSVSEAEAYLQHPVLGPRLTKCAEAALGVEGRSHDIFGSDDMKLRSCAILFALVSPAGSVFHKLLDKYFQGEPDYKTLSLLTIALNQWSRTAFPDS